MLVAFEAALCLTGEWWRRFVLARHKSLAMPLPYLETVAAVGEGERFAEAGNVMAVEDVLKVGQYTPPKRSDLIDRADLYPWASLPGTCEKAIPPWNKL